MADTKQSALTPRGTPSRSADTIMVVNGSTNYVSTINNELGLSGNPIGDSDSQTLTNKTLGSTNIITLLDGNFTLQDNIDPTKQAQFQLSGNTTGTTRTYTLPNASVTFASLTGTETLTNKTLTSPTLTSPTLTNASITQDAVVGFTTANSGTVYGVSVSGGTLGTNALATNAVQGNQLATNAITIGYAQITTSISGVTATTPTLAPGLSVTVTVPAGGRRIKITGYAQNMVNNTATATVNFGIYEGSTQLGLSGLTIPGNNFAVPANVFASFVPSAGSHTYQIDFWVSSNTGVLNASSTSPAFILVEVT